jgi:hypothetical protein
MAFFQKKKKEKKKRKDKMALRTKRFSSEELTHT